MISHEEFQRRHVANAAGGPRTWVCQCGHPYSRHDLHRDPTPSSPSVYHYYACDLCVCSRFLSEYDAAAAAIREAAPA